MTVFEPDFSNGVHFPIRLVCAILALVAVVLLGTTGMLGVPNEEMMAAATADSCVADTEECAQIWIRENLSNIEYTVGSMEGAGDIVFKDTE